MPAPRNILGVSAYYHDAAAALVVDGKIIAAAQEERFTRQKNDPNFPRHAREATGQKNLCLAGGVALNCVANGIILREKQ